MKPRSKKNSRRRKSRRSGSNSRILSFQSLEDRRLLATITVDTLADVVDATDGVTSLHEAIDIANGNGQVDLIDFSVSGTINLGSQLPTIREAFTINGDNQITIDAGGGSSIVRINDLDENNLADVTFVGLTLTGGDSGANSGGAILNEENLRVHRSQFYDNQGFDGGAISNFGQLTIVESTLNNNTSSNRGGAVFNSQLATTVVRNSTISGNVSNQGGGIYNISGGTIDVSGSTITNNSASIFGGGFRSVGTAHLTDSIVANNSASSSGDDITGTLATDTNNLIGGDPMLAPLADNGGPTLTHALLPGSPAIDAIAIPAPVLDYELDGGFAETLGNGSNLAPLGAAGTFSDGVYNFGAGQGLTAQVPSANADVYSIELTFSLDELSDSSGYQKLIDFNGPGSGAELYIFNRRLRYFISNPIDFFTGSIDLTAGQTHRVVLTRAPGLVPEFVAYVDGQRDRSFPLIDTNGISLGIFSQSGSSSDTNTARLLDVTQGGTLDRFRFFDRPLTETEVANLSLQDQRGVPYSRDVGAGRDIGAYEYNDLLVNSLGDVDDDLPNNGVTTLREAINLANDMPGHQNIRFDAALAGGTIAIGSQLPTVTDEVRIVGLGADQLTIDAGDGTDNLFGTGDGHRIFTFDNGTDSDAIDIEISGLTLTGGDVANGANATSEDGFDGGGGGAIFSHENLTIIASTISGNATGRGGDGGSVVISFLLGLDGGQGGGGGGILTSNGTLTVIDSTISGNKTGRGGNGGEGDFRGIDGNGGDGGGVKVDSDATLRLFNSTISGNVTGGLGSDDGFPGHGGGIDSDGTLLIYSSTLTDNAAGRGGAVSISGTSTIANSILAGNSSSTGGNVFGSLAVDQFNLIDVDPLLGPLADNGGPTMTHALLEGSPAIDAGSTALAIDSESTPLINDQRGLGFDRIFSGTVDIGAFEFEAAFLLGDVNQDGMFDFSDIPSFITVLQGGVYLEEADINGDGVVDFADIPCFIDLLIAQ